MATLPPTTISDAIGYTPIEQTQLYSQTRRSNLSEAAAIKELAHKAFVVAADTEYDGSTGILVEAWLPETLATDINANYESPLAQGLNGQAGNLGAMARFAGLNLTTQALTAQIWQGGGHIQFSLPFIFQAETSAAAEVMDPIKKLFTLTLPKDSAASGGGLLQAPGPHFDYKKLLSNVGDAGNVFSQLDSAKAMIDTQSSAVSKIASFVQSAADVGNKLAQTTSSTLVSALKNNISLYVGQFLYFPSVVIKDVNPTFDTILDQDKNPMRAVVNVNFETFYVPTSHDLKNMFPSSAALRTNRDLKGQGGR